MIKTHTVPTLARAGVYVASKEKRETLLMSVGQAVYISALRRAWQTLPVSRKDTFKALLDASNRDVNNMEARGAVEAFLSKHVPDWDRYLSEEVRAIEEIWHKTYGEVVS